MPSARSFDCRDPQERGRGLDAAVAALQRRQLIVMPLETSMAIVGDAFSPQAMTALRAAIGRPDAAVPVLVARVAAVGGIAAVDATAAELMRAFWPGPLTLVLPAQPSIAWDIPDAHGRLAVRMPLHPVALDVLERTGPLGALAAPGSAEVSTLGPTEEASSTNVTPYPAATPAPSTPHGGAPHSATAQAPSMPHAGALPPAAAPHSAAPPAAVRLFSDPLPQGPPSSVVDLTRAVPRLARRGAFSVDVLRMVCPDLRDDTQRTP